jgi:hypothetical protein
MRKWFDFSGNRSVAIENINEVSVPFVEASSDRLAPSAALMGLTGAGKSLFGENVSMN